VEGQHKRLKLGFGILAPGGAALPRANSVVFRISAVGGQGDLHPLWSQRLDPPSGGTNWSKQQAVIDLGPAPSSELVLETLSDGLNQIDGLVCYWSGIELE
jgi:hypothetical protein